MKSEVSILGVWALYLSFESCWKLKFSMFVLIILSCLNDFAKTGTIPIFGVKIVL